MQNSNNTNLSKANKIKFVQENYNKKLKILIQKQHRIITCIMQKLETNKIENLKKKIGL